MSNFLQYHTADTQGHKMCLFNTQVVNHSENVLADNVKIVFRKFRKNVLAITVVPQVDQEQTIMRLERFYLVFPRADTPPAPCTKTNQGAWAPASAMTS